MKSSIYAVTLYFFSTLLISISPAEPSKASTLKIGTLISPSSYYPSENRIIGFDYELATQFANFLDQHIEFITFPNTDSLLTAARNGSVDIIAANIPKSLANTPNLISGPTLYQSDHVVVYNRQFKKPANLNQLDDKLTIAKSSFYGELLSSQTQKVTWNTVNSTPAALLVKVAKGEISYTITDSANLALMQRYLPTLRAAFTLKKQQSIGWMLADNSDPNLLSHLLDFFNHAHQTGQMEHLQEKYFGHTSSFDYVDTRAFIRAANTKLAKYQPWFKKYSANIDWKMLAAISYQESHWNPKARSYTGVRGMMMLTRPTAKQLGVDNRLDAEQSIRGGAQYINHLVANLPKSIPSHERLWFALASYNIGYGHVEDARKIAQSKGLDPSAWKDVKTVLPLLHQPGYYDYTRHGFARGKEAVHYVENIRRYYDTLSLLTDEPLKDLYASDNVIIMSPKTVVLSPE
ncbi:membrane-bound lytic murein transglycosylase MltF [Paraferrimonas sp. SM1919]|uniref:membrane-bound lytic murein transglycosylase MltF n=1 Tax=Paraferrimonas sp. SM1919 TaxID=2662263 RepID=UPI0013D6A8C2|nr:membrane-bound lytic murein transglycosylase MltF [Paraferrimonas sp. SM1919]